MPTLWDDFNMDSNAPQPQGKQVADWYKSTSPEPIDTLHVLAHMKAERDRLETVNRALVEALEALISSRWLSIDFERNRRPDAMSLRDEAITALKLAKGE